MRKKVYIAGPMSGGDRLANLQHGLIAYRELIRRGYAPMCPMLSFFVNDVMPQDHATWLATDLPWVASADAILRLPGESLGAEQEVACAVCHGIPVFRSLDDFPEVICETDQTQVDPRDASRTCAACESEARASKASN
jgi:hypothetical protein